MCFFVLLVKCILFSCVFICAITFEVLLTPDIVTTALVFI